MLLIGAKLDKAFALLKYNIHSDFAGYFQVRHSPLVFLL